MAIQLLRKTDTAEFVARADDCADQNGKAAPHEAWLLAEGQPAACDRFRIRAPTAVEIAGEVSLVELGRLCYISGPLPFDDMPIGWQLRIGKLVDAASVLPLDGPGSKSMESGVTVASGISASPK